MKRVWRQWKSAGLPVAITDSEKKALHDRWTTPLYAALSRKGI
jgi:hypothetical protein